MKPSFFRKAAAAAVLLAWVFMGCSGQDTAGPKQTALIAVARENPAGSPFNELNGIPERYSFSYENGDGSICIQGDAPVILPETEQLPIVAVADQGFENELVKRAFRYFYPGERPFGSDGKRVGGRTKWMEQAGGRCKILSCQLPDREWGLSRELSVRSFGQVTTESPGRHFSMQSDLVYQRDDRDGNTCSVILSEREGVLPRYREVLSISLEEAEALGWSFLQALGLEDTFQLGCRVLLLDAAGKGSLQLLYQRKMGDCPVALTGIPGSYGIWGQESLPWRYEYLEIVTDDRGIAKVRWQNPITNGKTLVEDCRLLPFDRIAERLEAALPELYFDGLTKNPGNIPTRLTGSIDEIRLELLRIQDPEAEDRRGIMVPTWVFYGTLIREQLIGEQVYQSYDPVGEASFEQHHGPAILAAINGVDGSVIDMAKGY
ncbi:MAG: hypothetical protein IJF41_05310 [Clostridia bacterium]|nr:hypothetical protein [Clostridia bacterium]